jgi:DNA-binding NarL/FixJ family response regulator
MSTIKILVVEDEGTFVQRLQNKLRTLGYDSSATASSGEEAIHKAEENHPDLVLMDIRLEGSLDSLRAARQIQERFGIPVIYLTDGFSYPSLDSDPAEPLGCICKSFEEEALHLSIETTLYRHKMEKVRRFFAMSG